MAIGTLLTATMAAQAAPPAELVARTTPHASPQLLGCGGSPFRPSALRRARGYERRRTPAAHALNAFLRESADEVSQPRRGWFLLTRRGNSITFLAGRPPEYGSMSFERKRGQWTWVGSGGCTLRAFRDGLTASDWDLNPSFGTPAATATRVQVLVSPSFCNSGRDASGRVRRPYVHYGRRVVAVSFYVSPTRGPQTCPGSPPTPVVLILREPLGDRKLADLGAYPPTPRDGKLDDKE